MTRKQFAMGAAALGCMFTLSAAPPTTPEPKPADAPTVSIHEARERAKLLHSVYSATLDSLHHHFFRRDRAVLPARAMEDVFEDVEREQKIQARWIAVNTPAMSVDHEPAGDFEKKAAEAIDGGKAFYERIEKGEYKRAGAIALGNSCVGCHTKFFAQPPKTPRFAALVITIPVKAQ
jgi:hypothetical protein